MGNLADFLISEAHSRAWDPDTLCEIALHAREIKTDNIFVWDGLEDRDWLERLGSHVFLKIYQLRAKMITLFYKGCFPLADSVALKTKESNLR